MGQPSLAGSPCLESTTSELPVEQPTVPDAADRIIWTMPSTGVPKILPAERNLIIELPSEQPNHTMPTEQPAQSELPISDPSARVPAIQSTAPVTDLEYLINKMELATLRLAQTRFAPFPLLGANFKLSACRYIDSGTGCRSGLRCPYSHLMKPTHVCLATELQRHLDNGIAVTRVLSDTESTSEQPSEQLASTSLLACAPALGDRDCHIFDENRPCSPISSSRPMHPVPHIRAPQ